LFRFLSLFSFDLNVAQRGVLPRWILNIQSANHVKHSPPAGLVKEVDGGLQQLFSLLPPRGANIGRSFKRPVDKHWPANNVFPGDEPPVAAVQAVFAIVPHAKVVAFGNYQVLTLNTLAQDHRPPTWAPSSGG